MCNLKIADMMLGIHGDNSEYLKARLKEYGAAGSGAVDITIFSQYADNIAIPAGTVLKQLHNWRWILKKDGGYAAFQEHPFTLECISLLETDRQWSKVYLQLKDVENPFNADNDLRSLLAIGEVFAYGLLKRAGLALHASAISYNGNAVLFSAPSGTGKSTHTALWKQYYGETVILNDDMPAVRFIDDIAFACGTPWSGKSRINCNEKAPVKAIVFLERAERPGIRTVSGAEALGRIMRGVRKPVFPDMMEACIQIVDKLIRNVPLYVLSCDISKEAVDLVKNTVLND